MRSYRSSFVGKWRGAPAASAAAFILIAALLAGCVPGGAAVVPAHAGVVVAAPAGREAQALQAALADYPGGAQSVTVQALSGEVYMEQVSAALLAGLDRYDLIYLPANAVPKWANYTTLQAFDAPQDDNITPWLLPLTVDGKLYGLPTQPDPDVLWYRADLLQAAGLDVPQTWQSFRAVALALNRPPELYGAAIAGGGLDAGQDLADLLPGFGAKAVSDDGQVALINSPEAERALTFYANLLRDGVVDPRSAEMGRGDVINALREGRAGLGIAPASAGMALQDCAASPKACRDGKPLLAWAALPGLDQSTAQGSLGAWCVPLKAARADDAIKLAQWLTSADGARAWAAAGGMPAHQSVLNSLPDAKFLAGVRNYRLAFPPVAANEQLWKAVHTAAHAALTGEAAPAAALEEAAAQMQKALRQSGGR